MITKQLIRWIATSSAILFPMLSFGSVLESFTVTLQDAEVREFTESSIHLQAEKDSYVVLLEPTKEGKVIFSLSGIGYASTVRFANMQFGVTITGYCDHEEVYPAFSFDDVNRDIKVDRNRIVFNRIYGTLPVWFNQEVDSIRLHFSNSYSANMSQYLGIEDLKIVSTIDVRSNPQVEPCQQNQVMIAIDGSSSIDKKERTIIGKELLTFIRNSSFAQDSNQLCIMEFGTQVLSSIESDDRKELIKALQRYKRGKNNKSKYTSWTNWSAALDEALVRQPQLLIFITDGWSNWFGGQPASFSSQYEHLVAQSNALKANGTRILFVTSDIDAQENSLAILGSFLNYDLTCELQDDMLKPGADLSHVDLITLSTFSAIEEINFSSILRCPGIVPQMLQPLEMKTLTLGDEAFKKSQESKVNSVAIK